MRDYEKLVKKAQMYSSALEEFIYCGALDTYLRQGLRAVNLTEEKDFEDLLDSISIFAGSYLSLSAGIDGEYTSLYFKESELKHFLTKKYDLIDNFEIRFNDFVARIVSSYYQRKLCEDPYYSDTYNKNQEDNDDRYDYNEYGEYDD